MHFIDIKMPPCHEIGRRFCVDCVDIDYDLFSGIGKYSNISPELSASVSVDSQA